MKSASAARNAWRPVRFIFHAMTQKRTRFTNAICVIPAFKENLPPACVKSCPTGALTIGDKDEMIKKAYAKVEKLGGDANVYGDKFVDGTHVIYVLQFKPEVYDELPVNPKVPLSVIIWKDLLKAAELVGRRRRSWRFIPPLLFCMGRRDLIRRT